MTGAVKKRNEWERIKGLLMRLPVNDSGKLDGLSVRGLLEVRMANQLIVPCYVVGRYKEGENWMVSTGNRFNERESTAHESDDWYDCFCFDDVVSYSPMGKIRRR